jgi:DNA-binding GntR family transcriptional regulator
VSPGAIFERVYLALKEQLGSGRYRTGEPLEPGSLSIELNASITPVRDALHRLVGERLVESPRGDGFRFPLMTEMGVRHLYRWNAILLNLAARSASAAPPPADGLRRGEGEAIVTATERLFVEIAVRSGNPEHAAAVAHLNARLRPIRQLEHSFFPDQDSELRDLAASVAEGRSGTLRRTVGTYHRRRERLAAEIVARLHAGS